MNNDYQRELDKLQERISRRDDLINTLTIKLEERSREVEQLVISKFTIGQVVRKGDIDEVLQVLSTNSTDAGVVVVVA